MSLTVTRPPARLRAINGKPAEHYKRDRIRHVAPKACGHKADVNVDALPETIVVPAAGRRLRCSQCGGKRIDTRPWAYGEQSLRR